MEMTASANVGDWRGHDVFLADGDKLGKLEDLYYDTDSDKPMFMCVRSGTLSHKQVLVPVGDVHATPDRLTVSWKHEDVKNAPTTKPGEELSVADEERAFRHYGMGYEAPATASGRRLVRR
jgi:uncharacterized protein YrrD